MEASLSRSFVNFTNRHSINVIRRSKCHPLKFSPNPSPSLFLPLRQHTPLATLSLSNPNPHARNHFPNWKSSPFTPSAFRSSVNTPISNDCFARILSGHNDKSFEWKFAADGGVNRELGYFAEDKRPIVTVVVLGWLGSKQKHLRRYAELYNLFGMDAVTFAVSVNDVLGFDLGRNVETRITVLTNELVSWVKEEENDGRERFLIFHTFSNTGWLTYGAILKRLQGKPEILEKIKGCVVDSGGDPDPNPKVWAAGFTTALLKKQSFAVNSSSEATGLQNGAANSKADEKGPLFIEVLLLILFEKFFAFLLQFPDVKKRLMEVISTLSEKQPCHPQMYLYSKADKVIPFQQIEKFADHQKKIGRKVKIYDFKSTPHVDHYRTFPDIYRSLVKVFLKDCFAPQGKQLYNLVK